MTKEPSLTSRDLKAIDSLLQKRLANLKKDLKKELTETIVESAHLVLNGVQIMFDERDDSFEKIESDVTTLKRRVDKYHPTN